MKGYSETIKGDKNVFVTYEHLITVKAARNEFLKANGIPSIFVPKNAYTATQYFHSELYINYTDKLVIKDNIKINIIPSYNEVLLKGSKKNMSIELLR